MKPIIVVFNCFDNFSRLMILLITKQSIALVLSVVVTNAGIPYSTSVKCGSY